MFYCIALCKCTDVKIHLMSSLFLDGIDSYVNVIYLFKATIKLNYVVSCLIVSLSSI